MSPQTQTPDDQKKSRIMIIDDEPMIAQDIRDLLIDAGFEIAGVAAELNTALALIECESIDAAILDANLSGVSAGPIATALAARSLPFIVLSGYSPDQLRADFPGAVFMQKPIRPAKLVQAMSTLVAQR